MRVALFTREFPPNVYGGASVHVDYLSRELAKQIVVDVHCWGPQNSNDGNLHVRGAEPWVEISKGTRGEFKTALEALSLRPLTRAILRGYSVTSWGSFHPVFGTFGTI